MALVTATHLLTAGGGVTASSFVTASISPGANQLIILFVHSHRNGGGNPNIPTVTGAGMTWTQVATKLGTVDTSHRVTMFRALSPSPGSGALTIDFAAQNQDETIWSISEFAGVDTSGTNGANAVVQSGTLDGTGTSLTITLSAFSNTNNATHGVVTAQDTVTKGANFVELANYNNFDIIESEWASSNQTAVNWTFGNSTNAFAIAIEIKASLGKAAFLYNLI